MMELLALALLSFAKAAVIFAGIWIAATCTFGFMIYGAVGLWRRWR